MGGGQDKPAWTACPPGVKITRVGGKITRDSLPPGGQAVQGGKINCYTRRLPDDPGGFTCMIVCMKVTVHQRRINISPLFLSCSYISLSFFFLFFFKHIYML